MITVQVRSDRRIPRRDLTPSRDDRPLALAEAREEMDVVTHRFLYVGDRHDDGRGRVLYLSRDGDYGLVEAG